MAYLGDYIGYLVSEITNARAQADYEAVRLAELYAGDPYLKHIPVPRFRMPTVNLDVPVIINNIEDPEKGQYSNEKALSYMQEEFKKLLPVQLQKNGFIKLDTSEVEAIFKHTDSIFGELRGNVGVPLRITYITDKLVSAVTGALQKYFASGGNEEETAVKELGDNLRNQLYMEFSKYLREQPRLDITANTAELKNAGSKDLLAYLRFTITEEAIEWDTVEEDSKNINRRLIPE